MRRHLRTGLSLAAVAVLLAWSLWQWRSDRADATLLPLDPASISRISVTRQEQPTRHYARHDDGHWYEKVDGATTRVEDTRLQRLAALATTPVLEWRDTADMDAARVGLANAPVRVELDGHALDWGSLAAFGPQRFVRVGKRIAVVPARYSPRTAPRTNADSGTRNSAG